MATRSNSQHTNALLDLIELLDFGNGNQQAARKILARAFSIFFGDDQTWVLKTLSKETKQEILDLAKLINEQ